MLSYLLRCNINSDETIGILSKLVKYVKLNHVVIKNENRTKHMNAMFMTKTQQLTSQQQAIYNSH